MNTQRTRLPVVIRWIAIITLIVAVILAFNLTEWIRGGYGWRWNYDRADLLHTLPLIFILAIYAFGAYLLLQRTQRAFPVMLWSMIGTAGIAYAVAYAHTGDAFYALFTRTASGLTTGPHWAATRIDWASGDWQDWTTVMGTLGGHLGTSPPGLVLLYGGLNALLDKLPFTQSVYHSLLPLQCHNYEMLNYTPAQWVSTYFGILMPVWAALTVLPVYGITRRLNMSDTAGRYAVLWWALIPGIMSFAGSWSTAYPLLSATAFCLLLVGLDASGRKRAAWLFAAGLVSGIAIFSHFTFLPLLGLMGFYTLGRVWFVEARPVNVPRLLMVGVWIVIGLAVPWILFMLAGGDSPLDILRASFEYHLDLDRPYAFWVWFHVWDWMLWTGVALSLLWLVGVWRGWQTRHDKNADFPLLSASLALTVLVLTISGATQGESGRIWLFLSPFVVIAAVDGLNRITGEQAQRQTTFYVISAVQLVLTLVMAASLGVIGTDLVRSPETPQVATNTPINATFSAANGDVFHLVGWMGENRRSSQAYDIELSLVWQSDTQMTTPYWFGAFLVPPEGDPSQPVLWQPGEYLDLTSPDADPQNPPELRYPTTCWAIGDTVGDRVSLPLPADAVAGDYWISLAVFGDDTQTDGRLTVTLPDGTQDFQLGLGPVPVD